MATVIYPGGRFTHCIKPADYEPLPGALTLGPATFGKRTCDFLLGGKLVCMASEPLCVLGQIVGREHTSYGKSGYNGIDNDFSFNLLLAPYAPADFRRYAVPSVNRWVIRNDVAKHAPQGDLLRDVAGRLTGLVPLEPAAESPLDGYGVLWHFPDGGGPPSQAPDPAEKRQNNLSKLTPVSETAGGRPGVSIPLPVLHCECEGSRIWAVCNAMRPFLDILSGKVPGSPGPSATEVCHKTLGWIPFVGNALCALIELAIAVLLLPLVVALAIAALVAWLAAQAYDDAFLTGPAAKQLPLGATVVVQGVWTWDAGHAGHLELHPVTAIAVAVGVPEGSDPVGPVDPAVAGRVTDLKDRWCRLLEQAPPPVAPPGVGVPPVPTVQLTAEQAATAATQARPEHRWTVHPVIDGCRPEGEGGGPH